MTAPSVWGMFREEDLAIGAVPHMSQSQYWKRKSLANLGRQCSTAISSRRSGAFTPIFAGHKRAIRGPYAGMTAERAVQFHGTLL